MLKFRVDTYSSMLSLTKLNTDNPTKLPPPEKMFGWPMQASRERNWKEASQRWKILRHAYPNHPTTWVQGALSHIEAGELKQAEALLIHARQQFPNNLNALIHSAILAMRRQKWAAADAFLEKVREKDPENLNVWLQSAECAENQGNLKQASIYNQKACACAPDRPAPYIRHAEMYMRAGQWEQALERWADLRKHFPDIATGYLRAADAANQLGRPKDAQQLVLAHQYGGEILDDTYNHGKSILHGGHTKLGRLSELIWTKAIFNLHSEVHRNYLSYGWWILEPLLHMGVYYLVFGILLQRGGENYAAFLLTGLIPWMWFMKAVNISSNSIIGGQNLMLQVGLPSIVFPMVSLIQSTLKQIPVFILLFGFLWLQGITPDTHWWALIPVITVQTLLTVAFACMIAAIIPFIRDLSYLVPTGLTLLMFLSGIFYDYHMIASEWQGLFLINPMAFILSCYREIFIHGTIPDMQTLLWWGAGSAIACVILIMMYKRLRYIYPRIVMV